MKTAFTAPSVRYTIDVAQIPQKKLMRVILWLADRLLRVVEEEEDIPPLKTQICREHW